MTSLIAGGEERKRSLRIFFGDYFIYIYVKLYISLFLYLSLSLSRFFAHKSLKNIYFFLIIIKFLHINIISNSTSILTLRFWLFIKNYCPIKILNTVTTKLHIFVVTWLLILSQNRITPLCLANPTIVNYIERTIIAMSIFPRIEAGCKSRERHRQYFSSERSHARRVNWIAILNDSQIHTHINSMASANVPSPRRLDSGWKCERTPLTFREYTPLRHASTLRIALFFITDQRAVIT